VVVDDERLAREELVYLLEQRDDVDLVGQAENGGDALEVIEREKPDVVFLDVQMPGLTGFEVARRLLDNGAAVHLVFVTAYDQYALNAFEVNAVDYLLKPVDPARLAQAIERAERRTAADRTATLPLGGDDLARIVEMVAARQNRRQQVALKVGERFLLVGADDIVFASLSDDVVTIATGALSGMSNYRTLDELQDRLDPEVFWRVHRSHIVNINKIKEIVPLFSRNYILKMKDPKSTEIPVSRAQTRRLRDYLRL
jgi:two-component system LytT family response regulator/two-component system response regulator LytT